jgi:hypothetical protein
MSSRAEQLAIRLRAGADDSRQPLQPGDRFTGWAVPGITFSSGHVLALRCFTASSIGPGYRSVWHRDPDGYWTFYTSVPPAQSCARYFGRDVARTVVAPIDATWVDAWSLVVSVAGALTWRIELSATAMTRASSRLFPHLPRSVWQSPQLLRTLGWLAGHLLGSGPVVLGGRTPNGHWFTAVPRRVWMVRGSRAQVAGVDVGTPAPQDVPARLADVVVPRRGIMMTVEVNLVPPRGRHERVSPLGVPCGD